MATAPARALLEAFKWLRVPEIASKVDLVNKHWKRIAEIAELWAFLLEQELLVHRANPMCQQDYPSLAAKYISSRSDFVEFWRGAKAPRYLIYNSQSLALFDTHSRARLPVPLVYEDGFRAVVYQDYLLVTMGYVSRTEYQVVMYDVTTGQKQKWPCCLENRIKHAMAADADHIYISGGVTDKTSMLRSAEVLVPFTACWSALPPMNFPAHSHTMVVINSRLFSFGGGHDRAELYTGTEWVQLDLFLPLSLSNFGIVVTSFKGVIVVGGENYSPSQFVYKLDLMTGCLVKLAQTPPLSILHNAVFSTPSSITLLADNEPQSIPYSLHFSVKVQLPSLNLEATIWLEPSDTVKGLVEKFKGKCWQARELDLLVCVEGCLTIEDLSVIAAGISPSSHIALVDRHSRT